MPNTQNCRIKRRKVPYKNSGFWNAIESNDKIRYVNTMPLLVSISYATF